MLRNSFIIYEKTYLLAGFTMSSPGHFTAVIFFKGKTFFYDGMGTNDNLRLQLLCDEQLSTKEVLMHFII